MTDENDANETGLMSQHRRTLLKAAGVASGASLFAGTGVASTHNSSSNHDSATGDNWCPPCIDRLAGYTALAGENELPAEPDHVVDMYIEPRHVLFQETAVEETDVDPVEPSDTEQPPEEFPDFFFDPVGLHINPGDVVEFYNESEEHTITAMHPRFFGMQQRIPDGAPPFSSPPVMNEERWLYRFDEPGIYDLFCVPHFELGMVMRLVVLDEGCPLREAPELAEEFPPAVQTVFNAPELAAENIVQEGSIAWDDLTIEEQLDPATLFGE